MNNITVLIVDDESRMRKLIKDFLTQKEYKIIEAEDGEDALDKFEKNDEAINVAPLTDDNGIWNVGAQFKLKDVSLAGLYAKSNADYAYKDKGFYVDLNYKGAKASTPGSWGVQAKYYHWGDGVQISHGWDNLFEPMTNGFKGYKLGAKYAVAKGMVAEVAWWDTKDMRTDVKSKALWTAMHVTF